MIGGNGFSVPSRSHRYRSCATDTDGGDASQRDIPDLRKAGCPRFMTIYISCSSDPGTRTVRIEGWLEGEAVGGDLLVLEMNRPLDGYIKVSSAPLRKALEYLGR